MRLDKIFYSPKKTKKIDVSKYFANKNWDKIKKNINRNTYYHNFLGNYENYDSIICRYTSFNGFISNWDELPLNISNTEFSNSNFEHLNFEKVIKENPFKIKFIIFKNCSFNNVNFNKLSFLAVLFEKCSFKECTFNGANLSDVRIINCYLYDCKFLDSNLRDRTIISNSSFNKCSLEKINLFNNAYFHLCNFSECILTGLNYKISNFLGKKQISVINGYKLSENIFNKCIGIYSFSKHGGRTCLAIWNEQNEKFYILAGCFWGDINSFTDACNKSYPDEKGKNSLYENYSLQIEYLKKLEIKQKEIKEVVY